MLNKPQVLPVRAQLCLMLKPKKLCSSKKPRELVMRQQDTLAALGHTSGTEGAWYEKTSWQEEWRHIRDPTLNGLNMQWGRSYSKDPEGSNHCLAWSTAQQELPGAKTTLQNILQDYTAQVKITPGRKTVMDVTHRARMPGPSSGQGYSFLPHL